LLTVTALSVAGGALEPLLIPGTTAVVVVKVVHQFLKDIRNELAEG
jgi:hypothetical protein